MAIAPLLSGFRKPEPWNWSPSRVKKKWARKLLEDYDWWFLAPCWHKGPMTDGDPIPVDWGPAPAGVINVGAGTPFIAKGQSGCYLHPGQGETGSGERAFEFDGFPVLSSAVGATLLCSVEFNEATSDNYLLQNASWPIWNWRITKNLKTVTLTPNGRNALVTTAEVRDYALNMLSCGMQTDRHAVWINGVMEEETTAGAWSTANDKSIRFGYTPSYENDYEMGAYYMGAINEVIPDAMHYELARDPFALLEKGRTVVGFVPAAGGTTYDVAVTEALLLDESYAARADFVAQMNESMALSDANAARADYSAGVTESLGISDTDAARADLVAALAGAAALGDTVAAGLILQAATSEGMALDDTLAAEVALLAAKTEGIALGEAMAVLLTTTGAVAEAVAMAETFAAIVQYQTAIGEGVALGDTFTGGLTLQAAIAESLALGDTWAAIVPTVTAIEIFLTQKATYRPKADDATYRPRTPPTKYRPRGE